MGPDFTRMSLNVEERLGSIDQPSPVFPPKLFFEPAALGLQGDFKASELLYDLPPSRNLQRAQEQRFDIPLSFGPSRRLNPVTGFGSRKEPTAQ